MRQREKEVNKVLMIETENISPNPEQPRKLFTEQELKSLANSIRTNGLLQPITVRQENGSFILVSGERRLRAMKYTGMTSVPCIVLDIDNKQGAIFALLENLEREDLNFFEEAIAMKSLINELGLSQQELGIRLGKSQSSIANKLRLLRFDNDIQECILKRELNERQARALLRIEDKQKILQVIEHIKNEGLNVVKTEEYIEKLLNKPVKVKRNIVPVIKDVRVFINTINKAISTMNKSGINVVAKKKENEDFIEYLVRIPIAKPQQN